MLLVFDYEAGVRRNDVIGPDRRQQRYDFAAVLLVHRHEFDQFRQPHDGGERNDNGNDAANFEQDLPAILRHQGRAGEAGQRAAERDHAGGDDRERGAQIARCGFRIDRDNIGNDAADAEAGDQAQPVISLRLVE